MNKEEEKRREEKRSNFKERIWFIKYWVKYMKENSDKDWSKQQAVLIDSQYAKK